MYTVFVVYCTDTLYLWCTVQYIYTFSGHRDGEDPVPRDGVRQWRRGIRLPRPTRSDEGEGGESQV